jgi:hypothetical protein
MTSSEWDGLPWDVNDPAVLHVTEESHALVEALDNLPEPSPIDWDEVYDDPDL